MRAFGPLATATRLRARIGSLSESKGHETWQKKLAFWRGGLGSLALILTLGACGPARESPSLAPEFQSSSRRLDYHDDPSLSPEQIDLLDVLASQSASTIVVESWPRAGTVQRLDLDALVSGTTRLEQAYNFLSDFKLLWKVQDPGLLVEVPAKTACDAVTLQLLSPGGLPVFGAHLRFTFDGSGRLRHVIGRVSGETFDIAPATIGVEDAAQLAATTLKAEDAESVTLPPGEIIVFDPFFAYDAMHDAVEAWAFKATSLSGATTPITVDAVDPRVVVVGFPLELPRDDLNCRDADPGPAYPRIVTDDETGRPAFIDFSHFGGIPLKETATISRAYELMSLPQMKATYRDAAPTVHLTDGNVVLHQDGRASVTFLERHAGIEVAGAYVTVTFAPDGRAVNVASRFVSAPVTMVDPVISSKDARTVAENHVIESHCAGFNLCGQALAEHLAMQPPPVDLVILSSRLIASTILPAATERLAWRVETPVATIYVDALSSSDGVIGDVTRMTNVAAFPHSTRQFDVMNDTHLLISENGTLTGSITSGPVFADAQRVQAALDLVDAKMSLVEDTGMAGFRGLGPNDIPVDVWVGWAMYAGMKQECRIVRDCSKNPCSDTQVCENIPQFTENGAYHGEPVPGVGGLAGKGLHLSPVFVATDVVAHEYAHGVDDHSARLELDGESAALKEAYADVIAEWVAGTEGGGWLIGEDRPCTTWLPSDLGIGVDHDLVPFGGPCPEIRNLADPNAIKDARGRAHAATLSQAKARCSATDVRDGCHYIWSTVISRAATLVADGIPSRNMRGLGRQAMGNLYTGTLREHVETDRIVHHRQRLLNRCRTSVGRSDVLSTGAVLRSSHCDVVAAALNEVELFDRSVLGFAEVQSGTFSAKATFTLHAGSQLYNGCTMLDRHLTLTWVEGGETASTLLSQANTLSLGNGEVSVKVLSTGGATSREITLELTANWGYETARAQVADVLSSTPELCYSPPNKRLHRFVSTGLLNEWANFLGGEAGDHTFADGCFMPPGCTVERVNVLEFHKMEAQEERPLVDHNWHGYSGLRRRAGAAHDDLTVDLHWWHDAFSQIKATVVYYIQVPYGVDCAEGGEIVLADLP